MIQGAQGLHAVVDPGQQHCLASERDTGVGEPCQGLHGLDGKLVGVCAVYIHPQRMIAFEHSCQVGGDALGQHHGYFGSYADDLDVRNTAEADEEGPRCNQADEYQIKGTCRLAPLEIPRHHTPPASIPDRK